MAVPIRSSDTRNWFVKILTNLLPKTQTFLRVFQGNRDQEDDPIEDVLPTVFSTTPYQHLNQSLTLKTLEKALRKSVPEIHHSDQGVQYLSSAYIATVLPSKIWATF